MENASIFVKRNERNCEAVLHPEKIRLVQNAVH